MLAQQQAAHEECISQVLALVMMLVRFWQHVSVIVCLLVTLLQYLL